MDQCGGEKWLDSEYFEGQLNEFPEGVGEYHLLSQALSCLEAQREEICRPGY